VADRDTAQSRACPTSASVAGRDSIVEVRAVAGDLVDYTQTEPLLAAEVDADACFEHDRWRHAVGFRRIRGDRLSGARSRAWVADQW